LALSKRARRVAMDYAVACWMGGGWRFDCKKPLRPGEHPSIGWLTFIAVRDVDASKR